MTAQSVYSPKADLNECTTEMTLMTSRFTVRLCSCRQCHRHSSSDSQDPHNILGVPKNAPKRQIKEAYINLSKKFHPDMSDSPDSKKKFQEIKDAYDALRQSETEHHHHHTARPASHKRHASSPPPGGGTFRGKRQHTAGGERREAADEWLRQLRESQLRRQHAMREREMEVEKEMDQWYNSKRFMGKSWSVDSPEYRQFESSFVSLVFGKKSDGRADGGKKEADKESLVGANRRLMLGLAKSAWLVSVSVYMVWLSLVAADLSAEDPPKKGLR